MNAAELAATFFRLVWGTYELQSRYCFILILRFGFDEFVIAGSDIGYVQ